MTDLYFNDFCWINYLKINGADLRQIFRDDRTMDAVDQSEISF